MKNNTYLKTVLLTVLCMALLHLAILFFYAVSHQQWTYLNIADILDLKLIFPALEYTPTVTVICTLPVILLMAVIYHKLNKQKRHKD